MLFIYITIAYIISWIFGGGVCYLLNLMRKKRTDSTDEGMNSTPLASSNIKANLRNCIVGLEKWMIIRVGNVPSHWLRRLFYLHVLQMSVDQGVVIYSHCRFRKSTGISIGKRTVIGDNCWIDGRGGVHIGQDVNLSSEVRVWTSQHEMQSPDFHDTKKEVTIDDRAWISSNTIILPGVHIGEGAVIAAGAVVTKDADAYGIYAGVPARKIGERTEDLQYHFGGKHDWFM